MRKEEMRRLTGRIRNEDSRFVTARSPFYQTVRMLARYYARMNAVLKPSGIDVARWRILQTLAESKEAMTVSAIADECVVQVSTMTKTINRMVNEGLLTVRTSPGDARAVDVAISKGGLATLERSRVNVNYVFKQALRNLTETEVQLLNSVSARIYENLSD